MKETTTWLRAEWDRVAAVFLIGLGAVLLVLGWVGVSDSAYVAEQLAYLVSGGVGALFCLGLGVGLLLSADLHDEWRKLDRLEERLVEVPERAAVLAVDLEPEPVQGTVPSLQAAGNGSGRGR